MKTKMRTTKFVCDTASELRSSWRGLVATDLLYKLLSFVLLIPLFVALFKALLTLSGNNVLSDVDIAIFFAGPYGWFCALVLGAVWLGILMLEQASLMWILAERSKGNRSSVIASLIFSVRNALNVLRLTARMIGWSLVTSAPFLVIACVVYVLLLNEYDINYYLEKRPFEFNVAAVVGLSLALAWMGVVLRLYSGWFLALPLVLFEQVSARNALRESNRLLSGHRARVVVWLAAWIGFLIAANVLSTALIGSIGRFLIPTSIGSVTILATRVGLMLLAMVFASLVHNLVATISFSAILFQGYRQISSNAQEAIDKTRLGEIPHRFQDRLLTRGRLTVVGLVGVLAAALIGYWALDTVHFDDDVQIMAHRGASHAAPENTLAAFQRAISDGAEWIEIDVQETSDGEVVVLHDSDFMKLSANPLKIWDAKLEDLKSIDIGSWFDAKFSDQRVPRLADVLQLCKDRVGVIIELKYYGHDQQLEQRVVDIVEQAGMAEQVMVMSLKPQGVAKTKALRPDWKCGLLLSLYVGNLAKIDADFLAVNAKFATRSFVKRAHQAGKQVFVWTVNDAATMSQVMNRNVDGILTDRPHLARQVVTQRAAMSNSERLLTEISILFGKPAATVEQ